MKYFGPNSDKRLSYLVASVSGAILAVCSCSVLPMFAGIRKKGAGIGPATTFLFSGPALNILAITFTFSLIGVDIGFVRVFSAVILSIVIGFLMYLFYNKSETVDANEAMFSMDDGNDRTFAQNALFFVTMIGILVSGAGRPVITSILVVILAVQLYGNFKKDELVDWCRETYSLARKIVPLFIVGIFAAGVITEIIPPEYMVTFVGNNSYGANIIASVFGAFMYFATLTEVPIVNGFMELGMFKGPATALLLAGPSLSLPNMIVISRVIGLKKAVTYFGLVVVLSAFVGMLAGYLIY